MAVIITGTVLLLAVSIPIPFLNVKLLGLTIIVAELVKIGALQRASSWLWRNRRKMMPARIPDTAARVPLDTLLEASAPVARRAGRRAARGQRERRPGARSGQRPGRPERRGRHRQAGVAPWASTEGFQGGVPPG